MNRCPNSAYDSIPCPYALSENSPLPCYASFYECEQYRKNVKECWDQGIDPFNPSVPLSLFKDEVEQEKQEKDNEVIKVDSPLYGVEVDED